MKKFYLSFIIFSLLCAFNTASAIGTSIIKVRTNNPTDKVLHIKALIYGGIDNEGDEIDDDPKENVNISFEGANIVHSKNQDLWIELKSKDFIIKGDLNYLDLTACNVEGTDLSQATRLHEIHLDQNPISTFNPSEAPKLTVIWLSDCKNIKKLNLKGAKYLKGISLQNTSIEEIDFSGAEQIENLYLGDNPKLNTIDLTNMINLRELFVNGNNINKLDIAKCTLLERLECSKNNLSELDLSTNSKLEFISCWGNKIKGKSMDKLISSLSKKEPDGTEYELCIYNKYYKNEGNILTEAQAKDVKARGWIPKQAEGNMDFFTWVEFKGTSAGINTIKLSKDTDNGQWYDLCGRKIEKPTNSGIYIHNGKKIFLR